MEIERKFMVKKVPANSGAGSSCRIRQGYFPLRTEDVEIRLREKGSQHFITIKAGRGGTRLEEEIPISRKQLKALWPLVRRASIAKTRRKIAQAGRTIELDTYGGRHRGFKIAEVEFIPTASRTLLSRRLGSGRRSLAAAAIAMKHWRGDTGAEREYGIAFQT